MNLEEAQEWLKGNRSESDLYMDLHAPSERSTALANCAIADAANVQRAYWVVKAHSEGLMTGAMESLLFGDYLRSVPEVPV